MTPLIGDPVFDLIAYALGGLSGAAIAGLLLIESFTDMTSGIPRDAFKETPDD